MEPRPPLQQAIGRARLGKVQEAIALLDAYLGGNPELPPGERAKVLLHLGNFCRMYGDLPRAEEILTGLAEDPRTAEPWRTHSWIELSIICRWTGRYDEAFASLDRARERIDVGLAPGGEVEADVLHGHFHNTRGLLLYQVQRVAEAEEEFRMAVSFLASRSSPWLVNCQLNLANVSVMLGRRRQALRHLRLARSAMRDLGLANAYGLVHFFEILATFNLFVYRSEGKAIDALMTISEDAVKDFSDFRRVFDFFSSIIVQRHEGRFDLDTVRRLMREYGDDPVIKKYLPALLTGCPPPDETEPEKHPEKGLDDEALEQKEDDERPI